MSNFIHLKHHTPINLDKIYRIKKHTEFIDDDRFPQIIFEYKPGHIYCSGNAEDNHGYLAPTCPAEKDGSLFFIWEFSTKNYKERDMAYDKIMKLNSKEISDL